MKPKYLITFTVLAVVVIGVLIYLTRAPSPSQLAGRALSADTLQVRSRAAVQLTMLNADRARPYLRRVAAETKDPEVLIISLRGLIAYNDVASLPLFIGAMDHPEKSVRQAAFECVLRSHRSKKLPLNLQYSVDDSPEQRRQVTAKLLDYFEHPPPIGAPPPK